MLRRRLTDQSIQAPGENAALRAAAVQLNSTDDVDGNRAAADRLVREAADRGARLVVLPEKWNLLAEPERMLEAAEALDGPSASWACELARAAVPYAPPRERRDADAPPRRAQHQVGPVRADVRPRLERPAAADQRHARGRYRLHGAVCWRIGVD